MEGGKLVCKTGKFCHVQEIKGGEMVEVQSMLQNVTQANMFLNQILKKHWFWIQANFITFLQPFFLLFLPDYDRWLNNTHQEKQEDVNLTTKEHHVYLIKNVLTKHSDSGFYGWLSNIHKDPLTLVLS